MIRRRRSSALSLAFIVVPAILAATGLPVSVADAAAGDPPITTISPTSGSTVPADDLGLKVAFSCPAYTRSVEGEGEEEKKIPGTADDYGVRFSTSAATGPDGLLTTAGFGLDGEGLVDVAADKVTCSAELNLPEKPLPADLYEGTVYWQAYRACDACAPAEYETGPVNAFVVTPNIEAPELSLPESVYADYLTEVSFSTLSDLTGTTFVLQRWDGTEWLELASAPASGGQADWFVKLRKVGGTALRVVIAAPGFTYALEPAKLPVRNPAGKRSVGGGDDGVYLPFVGTATPPVAPAHLKIAEKGGRLENLRASVPATCRTGSVSAPTTAAVALKRARVAPDGTVVAKVSTKGATPATVTLVGKLHDRQFSGELTTTFLNCTGTRTLELDLEGKKPPKAEDASAGGSR